MQKVRIVFLWLVMVLSCGCGYHHLPSVGRAQGPAAQTTVRIFVNKTYRAGIETLVTQSLIDELARHSGGSMVDEAHADFVLHGAVLSYAVTPVSYSATDRVAGYRATVKIMATLVEHATGKVVWKGEAAEGRDFPANADIALQQNAETAATLEITRRLAEDIHERMQEDF